MTATQPEQHDTRVLGGVSASTTAADIATAPGDQAAPAVSSAGRTRGLSAPQVVLLVLVGGGIGLAVDAFTTGEPSYAFAIGFVTTSVLAALVAARSALFLAGVLAPLAFVAFGIASSAIFGDRGSGQGVVTALAVDTALWLTMWFPVLAAAAVPAAIIALVRSRTH